MVLGSFLIQGAQAQLGKPDVLYYKSWGVVIGIENYLVAPQVPGAVEDAKAVAQTLRTLGFDEVIELYDEEASSRQLHHILNDFLLRKVGRQDRVVIFFAGHAETLVEAQAEELGYLVPWDAQVSHVSKAVTFEDMKQFSRRTMAKHTLFMLDSGVRGWEVTEAQQLSLEGRAAPEEETEKRAVLVLTAGDKGEGSSRHNGRSVFVKAFQSGIEGAADTNRNGWLTMSELGAYVKKSVTEATNGVQHPQFVRLSGDGDMILIEGRKAAFSVGPEPKTEVERKQAARDQYEKAFALLQQGRSAEEALERLNRSITYDPTFGDAYVLKSFVQLEILPDLPQALSTAQLAIQHAPKNPDSHYTLGLILEKQGKFDQAEEALRQALVVNPDYVDVYYSLGTLYADKMKNSQKAVEAFQRYLDLGGKDARAEAAVKKAGPDTHPTSP